jgi:glutaredoxin
MKSSFSAVSNSLKAISVSLLLASASSFADTSVSTTSHISVNNSAGTESVILFSAEWCGYCQKAKQFLNENEVSFTELDLDKSDANIDLFEAKGGEGIPYLVVGDTKVSGFDNQDYKQALKLL